MSSSLKDAAQRKGSFLQTMKAVGWSFFGVRKSAEYEKDVSRLNPVHVVIAGVDGPGDQPAGLDAQEDRLDLAALDLDPHRLYLVAEAHAVVDAGGDSDLEQLALVGRRGDVAAYAADGRPRSSKANREIDRGQRRRGPPRRDHHQRARVGLESRHAPQHDNRKDGKQCRANPEKTSPRGQGVSCSGVPP